MAISRKQALKILRKKLDRLRKLDRRRLLVPGILVLSGIFLLYLVFLLKDIPNPQKLTKNPAPVSTKILDRNGKLLYEVYSNYRRTPVDPGQISKYVKEATVAIEDKNFYHHHGLDTLAIIRAAFKTLTGQRIEGGSTITQQLVKNALLNDSSRTIGRKIKEAILAVATEFVYNKDQILGMYLNYAPYGGAIYGIESASESYFGKHASQLDLAEAALLAGLPQSPTRYSPFGANPDLAINRQHEVLNAMVNNGYITKDQSKKALAEKLEFQTGNVQIKAPHFALMVRDELVQKYGEDKVNLGGLIVTTTLDLDLQQYIEASLAAEMKKIAYLHITNGAALVTHPNTGEILAMVGSKDYFSKEIDGQVNITTSLRQPGSSIKPINYAVGLLRGWTAGTMLLDVPTCFNVPGQKPYCPKDYEGYFNGPVSVRQALGNSLNVPAVKMLALNGLDSFMATASAMGISTWGDSSNYGLSLTLGGGEVKMTDMATAYSTFANQGVTVPLMSILKVETYDGKVLEDHSAEDTANLTAILPQTWNDFWTQPHTSPTDPTQPRTTLPEEVTFIISDILADNGARAAAFGPSSSLVVPGHTVSVKTGTTNDMRDNWTIGYTPDYLAATWVGNNDNSAMSYVASGVTGASPIWNNIMRHLLKGVKDKPLVKPQAITNYQVCNLSGLIATAENQCQSHSEYYIDDKLSPGQDQSPLRQQVWVRRSDKYPILPGDDTVDRDLEEHTVVSDPFTQNFCLDCAYPVDDKGHIQWPETVVNYNPAQFTKLTPFNFLSNHQ